MSVSSSSADDGVTEEINIGTDSSYGSQKRGEEVQRRKTMQAAEVALVRAVLVTTHTTPAARRGAHSLQ